jgi:ribose 5-phosphate isomerase B
MIKISLGSDHAGFELKEAVKDNLQNQGYEVIDFGTTSTDPVDYPDFIRPAAECVAAGDAQLGVVFGGSGNGEAMAANKVKGIRCALCWNVDSAKLAKKHNNANMLAIGGRMVAMEEGLNIVTAWLNAEFEGGRHVARIEKIEPPRK